MKFWFESECLLAEYSWSVGFEVDAIKKLSALVLSQEVDNTCAITFNVVQKFGGIFPPSSVSGSHKTGLATRSACCRSNFVPATDGLRTPTVPKRQMRLRLSEDIEFRHDVVNRKRGGSQEVDPNARGKEFVSGLGTDRSRPAAYKLASWKVRYV
jgi:hypothetical protein